MLEIENNNVKPLISFVLIAYKQEKFIREAVEAAFAQDYPFLEIILSDDCSSDKTYSLMEELAANYQGNHRVILNRTERNLGLVGHVNQVIEKTQGDFIVLAGGDDISAPERVSEVYQAWIQPNKKITAVLSNLEKIDSEGTSLGKMFSSPPTFARDLSAFKKGMGCWVVGASFSFDKKIYSHYGKINPTIGQEDGALAFRALLEGEISYLDKLLVKYRHHGNNLSQTEDPGRRLILQKKAYFLTKGWLEDSFLQQPQDLALQRYLKKKCKQAYLKHLFFQLPYLGYIYNVSRIKAKHAFKGLRKFL